MDKLLQLLLEAAQAEERSLWYAHGYETEDRSLQALQKVLERALAAVRKEGE